MASKSVHQEFDQNALQYFSIHHAEYLGLVTSTEPYRIEKVLSVSKLTFEQINTLLTTETLDKTTFNIKTAGFLLPLAPITIDRTKASLKENGIKFTNDYEEADFIITHDSVEKSFSSGEALLSTCLMFSLWNYYTISDSEGKIIEIEEWIKENNCDLISDKSISRNFSWNYGTSQYNLYMVTGMALNIAYKIAIKQMDVIHSEIINYTTSNKLVLTPAICQDINRQIQSSNDDDTALAGKIIPTIDYTKNMHLLWELCKQIRGDMNKFNRNKDVQYWKDQSNFNKIAYKDAEKMVAYCIKNETITKESFMHFEKIARTEITIDNRELYTFKVQLKPEYQKYLL